MPIGILIAMKYTRMQDERAVHQRAQELSRAVGPIVDMTQAEVDRASIGNFVRAVADDDKGELAFFQSLRDPVQKATGRAARGFNTYLVPGDVTRARRDFQKAGTGGYLVGSSISGFAAALDAASLVGRLPVTRLDNMVGDATIARETVKGSATWLDSETDQAPDAQSTFGQVSLSPKTISATITVSRQLLKQSGPAGNAFIERALAITCAEAVDRALVAGTGTLGQPTGLLTVPGIDTRAGTGFTYANAAAMYKVAAGWSASDSIAWIAGVDAAEDLQTRERATGSGFIAEDDQVLGAPLVISRSIGAQVLAVMPWSQLWFASWGALEIGVDPFTNFNDGRVIVRCLWSIDFGVERPASVAVATALT